MKLDEEGYNIYLEEKYHPNLMAYKYLIPPGFSLERKGGKKGSLTS